MNQTLRKRLADEYRANITQLTNSNVFKTCMEKYGFLGYKYCILENIHRKEAIAILVKQFSTNTGNILADAVDVSFPERDLSIIVDHAIQAGISCVMLDKNDNVCLVYIQMDVMDEMQEMTDINSKHRTILEILDQLHVNDNWYQHYVVSNDKKRIGEVICGVFCAIRSDIVGTNLLLLTIPVTRASWVNMQYTKYWYAEMAHPATIYVSDVLNNYFFNNILRKNSDSYCYSSTSTRLNLYQYFKNRFENDEGFKANKCVKEDEVMKRLKKDSEITLFYVKYDEMRKHYSMEDVYEKFINFLFHRKRKSKL
eukprot:65137_1